MAACKGCSKPVGCGCNLDKEGLCAVCAKKKREELNSQNKNVVNIPEGRND